MSKFSSAQPIDTYAATMSLEKRHSVQDGATAGTEKRFDVLFKDYEDPDALRELAGKVKDHTLSHLSEYLRAAEEKLTENGAHVHFADTDSDVRETVLEILKKHHVTRLTKSKSMASEEIHLNPFLEKNNIECLESDLGEFILQIDGDEPSHIVKPIIHKNRKEIAESFLREGIAEDFNSDPETITRRARVYLRKKYFEAQAGITGANFVSAESGRIVLVTNEGNARFAMAPVPVHIVIVGIEKLVPRDKDLGLFLNLLGRSATGQQLTVYTQFVGGPKHPDQPSGPEHMHVIFMNNGRTGVLETNCREILRCIRCSACQNICPVYRQSSGHAYRSVYGGPIGSVLSPLLFKDRFAELADLPKACSLCGACNEVCPVNIPLPDHLLRLRDKAKVEKVSTAVSIPMGPFSMLATSPKIWRSSMTAANAMNYLPVQYTPVKVLQHWLKQRTLPKAHGGEFRKWMKSRGAVKK